MYLLDTNAVSIVAPARRRTPDDERFGAWVIENTDNLYLSVVTAAEIEDGIAKARRTGATRKADILAEWWGEVIHYWSGRILPLDLAVARQSGLLIDRARASGISPGFEDIAIAATAMVHSLTVVTANDKDFRPLGAPILAPSALPPS